MAGQIISRGPRKWLVRVYTGSKVVEGKRKKPRPLTHEARPGRQDEGQPARGNDITETT